MEIKLYNVNDLARMMFVSTATIYNLLKKNPKSLPHHVRIGRRAFFTQEAIDAFLKVKEVNHD